MIWQQTTGEDEELVYAGGTVASFDDGGGGFCSYSPKGRFDPVLPSILFATVAFMAWRSRKSRVQDKH